jgi:hypothetical protein
MEEQKEVNSPPSIEEMVDSALAPTEQAQEQNSPEIAQAGETTQNEDNSVKTGITAEVQPEGNVPESIPYQRFQEINKKEKEAREAREKAERQLSSYSKLLDDPEVYYKWLLSQGYNDSQARQAMLDKGWPAPSKEQVQPAPTPADRFQSLAENVCKKYGWSINNLNEEQRAYVQDSVKLMMGVIEEAFPQMLDSRFKPLEDMAREMQVRKQISEEEEKVKKLASEEFSHLSWEEHIKPAITKFLNDLDEKDPKRTIKLSYEDVYYRATRPLFKEHQESSVRQEARDKAKANARPLRQTVPVVPTGKDKPEKPLDFLEKQLDSMGVR